MNGAPARNLTAVGLQAAAQYLRDNGGRMQMAYALPRPAGGVEVRYLVAPADPASFALWCCAEDELPSLATIWPLLGWYEREMTDLYGVRFIGHPEPAPLVLPATTPAPFAERRAATVATGKDVLPEIRANDLQVLPFGPVRADVLESAGFSFVYVGEHIVHYHPDLFLKHRGMESRFEGLGTDAGVILAERVSAVGTVAHALAYCQAVEAACGCDVPPRARWLRSLLAELERVYNHLHYFGHLANTTTLRVGEAQGKLLEEQAKQINARLTGSRFLRGLLTLGGLRRDLDLGDWLSPALEALRAATADYVAMLERSDSHLDRLITTGHLSARVAFEQGATGPVQRASGIDRDVRRDHPYAAYADLPLEVPVSQQGDAHARAVVRAEELDNSIAMMQRILLLAPKGEVRTACAPVPGTEGLGWTESPRGSLFYAVHLGAGGRLARVKVKSPSFSNWRVFPSTVHDTNMMDYAINEASFGLTIAGCAR